MSWYNTWYTARTDSIDPILDQILDLKSQFCNSSMEELKYSIFLKNICFFIKYFNSVIFRFESDHRRFQSFKVLPIERVPADQFRFFFRFSLFFRYFLKTFAAPISITQPIISNSDWSAYLQVSKPRVLTNCSPSLIARERV